MSFAYVNEVKTKQALNYIESAKDEGISLKELCRLMNIKEHAVKSFVGQLISQGKVKKHPTLPHYFLVNSLVKPIESGFFELVKGGEAFESPKLIDKVLAKFGLKRL